ncbi:tetratricopeptide repeat protein, partial [Longimicrobium sp.]|uniref:tetratricopeptide repeat protein n=1 Tax=Longimicrobium sp. TaxID=2029185 RepID=UPI002F958EDF
LMGLDGGTLDFEPTSLDFSSPDDGDDQDGGRGISLAGFGDEEDAGDPLPLMGLDDGEDGGGDLPLMDSGDFDGDAGGYGGRLPLMDDEDEDGEDGGGDLPLMSFDDEPAAPPPPPATRRAPARRRAPDPEPAFVPTVDRLDDLRAHVAAEPADEASRDELVRELRARGLAHDVEGVLENAHRALAARGMYYEAVAPITALIGLRPDDGLLLQKRVEYAFRSGRPEPQVEAYLDLGRHFARHGHDGKAAAVFKRVLELDPHNVEARAAAAQLAPAPAAPAPRAPAAPPAAAPAHPAAPSPAPAAPPENEYVDLGALILGDDDEGEASTRFIVEEKEPSGDEDKDFAEMLASFRQKVAENIDVEDNASHYDLGVAFMEMGLIDEAISEFQVALRGGAKPLATLELLGQCFVEKTQYAVAGRVLDRALKLPGVADGDLVGVLYLLGRVEEGTGRPDTALEYYERVVSVDIRFRDTAQRVDRLRASRGAA